jgi:WD40 repeat protein
MTAPVIPDHTLLRPIGRGAYGEVWLARNVMGALRAVKVIWQRQFESDRPYEREFAGIQRYEPVSRSSGGLVHVLHVGRNDREGYFYYVMELADAQGEQAGKWESGKMGEADATLSPAHAPTFSPAAYSPRTLRSDLQRRGRLSTADCLCVALEVASGLAQLHRLGLVHRDVKPGNIIYVQGRAKLADIGLVSGGGEGRTFVGTEGYIPPEGPGSPVADLYALGIVLYEASTGLPPERFPDVPPEWLASTGGDDALELHEVILKACESQRERRYQSTEEIQADLALLQSGQSVRRGRALERRYARLRLSGIVGTTLLVCALVAAFFANYRARLAAESRAKEARLREQAQASLNHAENAEREARQQLYTALLEQGRATVRSGELGQRVNALDAVRRAAAISNSAALRGVALAALALPDLRFERELPYGSEFTLRHVNPAFDRIALCRRAGPVEIRATSDQRLLATLPASTNLQTYYAEWSPDGRYLALKRDYDSAGARSDKEVWDVSSARQLLLLHDAPFNAMSFHPRLPRLLVGRTNGAAVWDLEECTEVNRVALNGAPHWLRFAPDGEHFAASYGGEKTWGVAIRQIATGELICSNSFDAYAASFNWHPSGRWLAVTDHSGSVHRLDARTGEKRLLGRHKAEATRVEFTPDGAYLMSGGWERELICWDASTLQRAFGIFLNGYVGRFRSDGRAYALETESGVQLHAFERASGYREFAEDLGSLLRYAAFSADNRWLAAAGTERLGVWDLESGGPGGLATKAWGTRVCFSANGELFASRPGGCFRWRVAPGVTLGSPPELVPLELAVPEGFVSLSVASNAVVLTGARGSAVIGNDELGAGRRDWKRTAAGLNGVSPDGRWLALFRSFTPYLFVHRLPDLERVAILTNASNIRSFQFSPAGDELAVSCRLGVELWSTGTWQRTRTITNLNNQFYSAHGQTMWLTQELRTSGLHDAHTLELLLPLPVGTFPLAVSPDGRRLAVSVDLRRLQVWDLVEVRQQLAQLGLDWQK